MVKVVFVVHNMREGDIDLSFPLGASYLAAILENAGADVEVLDLDALGIRDPDPEILSDMLYFGGKPDFVCIGFASARFNHMKNTFKGIRMYCDRAKACMVIGGHAPSATPVYMREVTGADVVICGEAETAIYDVVFELARGIIIRNPVKDLDDLPYPAWHLFDMEKYCTPRTRLYTFDNNERMAFITTSRGCIGKCSFCYRMNKGYRTRGLHNLETEIKMLKQIYGIGFLFIFDETAFTGTARTKKLCGLLEKMDIKWATANRAETLQTLERAQMLKDAGCTNVGIGFESMDADVLKRMNKMVTPEKNIIAAENCHKVGLDMSINMLWNMPGDTEESLRKNTQFILDYSTWNECRTVKPVTPYPGSPLYYEAIEKGKLEGAEDFYKKLVNLDLITVNFMRMPKREAYELLYESNCILIDEYCKNAKHDLYYGDAETLKKGYYDLYFNNDDSFRGVR